MNEADGRPGQFGSEAETQIDGGRLGSLDTLATALGPALDMPAVKNAGAKTDEPVSFGQYKLIRRLGEGGMGQVWLAEQTMPVQRQVALKLIKAGMYDAELLQRFQAERQSLAMMDHPAIAKVFDAGATPDGQPYFVMEYVPGCPSRNTATRNISRFSSGWNYLSKFAKGCSTRTRRRLFIAT